MLGQTSIGIKTPRAAVAPVLSIFVYKQGSALKVRGTLLGVSFLSRVEGLPTARRGEDTVQYRDEEKIRQTGFRMSCVLWDIKQNSKQTNKK